MCDLGNQRFRLNRKAITFISKDWVVKLNHHYRPGYSDYTPQFRDIGFDDYVAIDMNSKMSAIPMDLNTDLSSSYLAQKHALVIDNGTGEHVFDQHMIFKNQHDLCAVGGIIINNSLSFLGLIMVFAFNCSFRDLAYSNSYEPIFTWRW